MEILLGFLALIITAVLGGFFVRAVWRLGEGLFAVGDVLGSIYHSNARRQEEEIRKARLAEAAEQEAADKEAAAEAAMSFSEQVRYRLNSSQSFFGRWTGFTEPLEVSAIVLQFRNGASGEEVRLRFTYDFHYDRDLRMEALGCSFIHFYDGPSAEYKGHPHPHPCGRVFLDDEINECANKLADYIAKYPEGYEAKAHAPADAPPSEIKERGAPFDETLLDLPEAEDADATLRISVSAGKEDDIAARPGFYAGGDPRGGSHLEPNADGQGFSCAPVSADEADR